MIPESQMISEIARSLLRADFGASPRSRGEASMSNADIVKRMVRCLGFAGIRAKRGETWHDGEVKWYELIADDVALCRLSFPRFGVVGVHWYGGFYVECRIDQIPDLANHIAGGHPRWDDCDWRLETRHL